MKTLMTSLAVVMTLTVVSTASAQPSLGQRLHFRGDVRDVRREVRQAGVIVSPSERREIRDEAWDVRQDLHVAGLPAGQVGLPGGAIGLPGVGIGLGVGVPDAVLTRPERHEIRDEKQDVRREVHQAGAVVSPSERRQIRSERWDVRRAAGQGRRH